MARDGLRLIGVLCLGSSLLAGFSWREAYLKLFPIDQEALLQSKQLISAPFIPEKSTSEKAIYQMELQFKDLQKKDLKCNSIRELPIKWTFSKDVQTKTWDQFLSQKSDCQELEDKVIVRFSDLEFKPGSQQYLQVLVDDVGSINNRETSRGRIRVRLTHTGLDFHYGSLDIEIAALITLGSLAISVVCGVFDLVMILEKGIQSQPNNSEGTEPPD